MVKVGASKAQEAGGSCAISARRCAISVRRVFKRIEGQVFLPLALLCVAVNLQRPACITCCGYLAMAMPGARTAATLLCAVPHAPPHASAVSAVRAAAALLRYALLRAHVRLCVQLEQAALLRKEAAAEREVAAALKQRALAEASAAAEGAGGDAAAAGGGARPLSGAASGLKAAFGGKSLRDVLGLAGGSVGTQQVRPRPTWVPIHTHVHTHATCVRTCAQHQPTHARMSLKSPQSRAFLTKSPKMNPSGRGVPACACSHVHAQKPVEGFPQGVQRA